MHKVEAIVDPIIKKFLDFIHQNVAGRVSQIILFGSRARGSADNESDYDFMIVLNKMSQQDKALIESFSDKLFVNEAVVLAPIVISDEDFKRRRYEPLIRNVQREGVLLF